MIISLIIIIIGSSIQDPLYYRLIDEAHDAQSSDEIGRI
jgi:hypothetical protein